MKPRQFLMRTSLDIPVHVTMESKIISSIMEFFLSAPAWSMQVGGIKVQMLQPLPEAWEYFNEGPSIIEIYEETTEALIPFHARGFPFICPLRLSGNGETVRTFLKTGEDEVMEIESDALCKALRGELPDVKTATFVPISSIMGIAIDWDAFHLNRLEVNRSLVRADALYRHLEAIGTVPSIMEKLKKLEGIYIDLEN